MVNFHLITSVDAINFSNDLLHFAFIFVFSLIRLFFFWKIVFLIFGSTSYIMPSMPINFLQDWINLKRRIRCRIISLNAVYHFTLHSTLHWIQKYEKICFHFVEHTFSHICKDFMIGSTQHPTVCNKIYRSYENVNRCNQK